METEQPLPASPCINRCCLDDKDICVGCKRSLDEILQWSKANREERETILQHCKERAAQ